jgi:hypothetical protein
MKSQRINGKGKEIQTPPFPTSLAEEWELAQRGIHSNWPYPSCSDASIIQPEVVQTTSRCTTWADSRDYSGNHNPEDYDRYLEKVSQFSIGDFVIYKWHKENDTSLTLASIRCILFKMPKEEMTWPRGQGWPKPWVAMNCAGVGQKPAADAWVSYEDLADHRLLTVEEYDNHIKNNVQLPDYIQQVKDAIKARTCSVNG